MAYKKIRWTELDVRCPFYRSDEGEGRCISCEGIVEGMDSISRFRSMALKDRHMGLYCVAAYEHCPMYRSIYASKYADGD